MNVNKLTTKKNDVSTFMLCVSHLKNETHGYVGETKMKVVLSVIQCTL